MARTPYEQVLALLDRLSRDEHFELINVLTARLRGVPEDSEPDDDEPEAGASRRKSYPRMGALLKGGAIRLRDSLYVEGHEDKPALLLDKNTVAYEGGEMRINDWACEVTGWSSISIYRHVVVTRLGKTLGQVRGEYMRAHGLPE